MGVGIGLSFAASGADVTVLSRNAARGTFAIARAGQRLVSLGVLAGADAESVRVVEDPARLPRCCLVVESLPEDLELKRALFATLSLCQPEAILASNTSSLRITDIARDASRPERIVGTHFWYPAPLMPLVEVVPGEATDGATLEGTSQLLSCMGKTPVTLQRDIAGFVWNRLTVAVLREAKWLVDEGVVEARDIDLVVERGLALRWSLTGPFSSAALGGAAIFETIGANLAPQLSAARDLSGLADLVDGLVTDPGQLDHWRSTRLAAQADSGRNLS
jgi:3-hydroxybutyryl-CoA dehydrogenase